MVPASKSSTGELSLSSAPEDIHHAQYHITINSILPANKLAAQVLKELFLRRGKSQHISPTLIRAFEITFLEEIPPGPLHFPIAIINAWLRTRKIKQSIDKHITTHLM